jgi:hypothetical protein
MIEFKPLDIGPKQSWLKRTIHSPHTKKTILFTVLGAAGGFLYFYFTEGQHMTEIPTGNIIKSILIGSFFGIFITNSPCARNKC